MSGKRQLKRLSYWEEGLRRIYESRKLQVFEYGYFDCCLFAADGILAMTGVDLARDFRGYSDVKGAQKVLSDHGGLSELFDYIAKEHGLKAVQPHEAKLGDPGIVSAGPLGESAGLMISFTTIAIPTVRGFSEFPKERIKKAWRIPF